MPVEADRIARERPAADMLRPVWPALRRRGLFLRAVRVDRTTAAVPRTAAPVAATTAATGPPATAAAAMAPMVLFVPVTASGSTGQPPGVWSTVAAGGAGSGGFSTGGAGAA